MNKLILIFLIVLGFSACNTDNSKYIYTLDVIYSCGDRDTFSVEGFSNTMFQIDRSTFSSKSDLIMYLCGENILATNVRRFNILSKTKIK